MIRKQINRGVIAQWMWPTRCSLTKKGLRLSLLFFVIVGCALATTRSIVLNTSPSIPLGLYYATDDEPAVGQLIELRLTANTRSLFPGVPICARRNAVILKPIAAGPGDYVDTTCDSLRINGQRVAPIHTTDSNGCPLHVWRANRKLGPDEFLVYSGRVPNSFDSRYFGPVLRSQIITVRTPLWTWGAAYEPDVASDVGVLGD